MPQEGRDNARGSNSRHILVLLLLIFSLTGFLYHHVFDSSLHGGDFAMIFNAARALRKGLSEYAAPPGRVRYVYSPLVALALHPMTRMSVELAIHVWFFICILFVLSSIAFYARSAGIRLRDSGTLAVLFVVAFYFRPTTLEFLHGQFNTPMLALVSAAYLADRRGRFYLLASLLAIAGLIKIWLLGLLVYLLVRRVPRAFIWGVVFHLLCLAGLFAKVGWNEAAAFYRITTTFLHRENDFGNQSILGFARIRFAPSLVADPIVVSPLLLYLTVAIGFAALAYGLWFAYRVGKTKQPSQMRLMFGLTIASLLLGLPMCERPYFILLLPALWTLLTDDATPTVSRLAAVGIYVVFTFIFSPPAHAAPGWDSWSYSAFFFATAALWLVLLLTLTAQVGSERGVAAG